MLASYTKLVQKILDCAKEHAKNLNSNFVGTEDVLYSICHIKEGVANNILLDYGIKLENINKYFNTSTSQESLEEIFFSPKLDDVLDKAKQIANELNIKQIGSELLLFSIVKQDNNLATNILKKEMDDFQGFFSSLSKTISTLEESNEDGSYINQFGRNLNELAMTGKIENVIKYAKHGFAEHRILDDIDTFNKDCIAWLNRTANAEEHGTTKKVPAEVFEVEKDHLIPVPAYSFAKPSDDNITYHVRKDNTVLYKSNRYRVPVGTYSKGKLVYVILQDEMISIIDADTGVLYAQHPLCTGKGELIGDSSRKYRDKSKSILELEASTIELFKDSEGIRNYLDVIHVEKRRYYRDQLGVIRSLFTEWDSDLINKALKYCLEHKLYSAGELSSAVSYMASLELENKDISIPDKNTQLPAKYMGNGPQIRSLSEYEEAMGR